MSRVESIGGIYAAVFEDYRRHTPRVPLLEHRGGEPINPQGRDLWVLCLDERTAGEISSFPLSINEYVTDARSHTYETALALVPSDAAVIFGSWSGDDDAVMRQNHPDVRKRGQRFTWRNGTYFLEAETAEAGQYVEREARIGPAYLTRDDFHAQVAKASERLARRAPVPFPLDGDTCIGIAGDSIMQALTAPAARLVRHWLETDGKRADLTITAAGLVQDMAPGVAEVTFTYATPRIRTAIRYAAGGTLNDLGLKLPRVLPDTAVHGLVGMQANRIVDAACLGPWPIRSAIVVDDGAFLGLDMPAVPLTVPQGAAPLDDGQAVDMLAAVLGQDLRHHPLSAASIAAGGLDDEPCLLKGRLDALGVLSALDAETAAFVLRELLDKKGSRMTVAPWLGAGSIEIRVDEIVACDLKPMTLAHTMLTPAGKPS